MVEILVVLLIFGITLSLALMVFGDFGARRRVVFASEQFVNYIKLVQQQAVLEMSTLGIRVNQSTYQALRFDPFSGWRMFPANGIFRQHAFPASTELRFHPSISSGNGPELVMNESGDITPFHLSVELNHEVVASIDGLHNGTLLMEVKSSS